MGKELGAIAVLGAGSWGTALSLVLASNGQEVHLWDRDDALLEEMSRLRCNRRYLPEVTLPDNVIVCRELPKALENIQDILLVIPSHGFVDTLRTIKPFLLSGHRLIWATKGLEPETGHFFDRVVEREWGSAHPYAVLSGPSFAKEVALGLPTAVAIASRNKSFLLESAARFQRDLFDVVITDDLTGVQLGAVVKNVLAVAVGISDGVQFGSNARAALITRGIGEMLVLGKVLGARPETLIGLAGCGDIILTCTDNESRNRRFGLALAKGLTKEAALQEVGQVIEAVYNVEQLCGLAKAYEVELPIAEQVFRVIKGEISPTEAMKKLFHYRSNGI